MDAARPGHRPAASWPDSSWPDAAAVGLLALACLVLDGGASPLLSLCLVAPLLLRRARPTLSAAAVFGAGLVQLVLGIPPRVADVAVLVALYSVTVHGPRLAQRVAIAAALAGVCLQAVMRVLSGQLPQQAATVLAVSAVAALAAWSFGLARRVRLEQLDALHERAERLERESRHRAAIAIADERSRIAREMHDVVAHSLSVIVAQADGGRYAGQQDPAAALRSLGTIGETGRAALADMRAILGVLRRDDARDASAGEAAGEAARAAAAGDGIHDRAAPAASPAPTAPLAPQPAGGDLEALVQQVREAGTAISLARVGVPRPLPAGAGLTLYRICQEALTNVLKHAGPGPAVTVLQRWSAGAVDLTVTDDGRGASAGSDGAGQGLVGMRERAAMFGGTVTAGPRPGGGFAVHAHLPLPAGAGWQAFEQPFGPSPEHAPEQAPEQARADA